MKREYNLNPKDCKNSTELFIAVLNSFLQKLPLNKTKSSGEIDNDIKVTKNDEPKFKKKSIPTNNQKPVTKTLKVYNKLQFNFLFNSSVNIELKPFGGSLTTGIMATIGSGKNRLITSLNIRCLYPYKLGNSRFISLISLIGAGWQYNKDLWQTNLEIRAGKVYFEGFGYKKNFHSFKPWYEAALAIKRKWALFSLGPEISYSYPEYQITFTDKSEFKSISFLRIGIIGTYSL